jgi:Mg2+ and Co2+ transporter CorA
MKAERELESRLYIFKTLSKSVNSLSNRFLKDSSLPNLPSDEVNERLNQMQDKMEMLAINQKKLEELLEQINRKIK